MIGKTTLGNSKSSTHLVLIPGGPGLSSHSIRGLDTLGEVFKLHYLDFPGTNGIAYDHPRSFEDLSEMASDYVAQIEGKVFVVGHSYGGLIASQIAIHANAAGLVCIGTPFTKRVMDLAALNYEKHRTAELIAAEKEWSINPSDESFTRWLSEYGLLYFAEENLGRGRALLAQDRASAKMFKNNAGDTVRRGAELLGHLSNAKMPKLFLAGAKDSLLPENELRADANRGGFAFGSIKSASHFSMVDQPEEVARLVLDFYATLRE